MNIIKISRNLIEKRSLYCLFFVINPIEFYVIRDNDRVFQLEQNKRIKNTIRQKVQIVLNDISSPSSTNISAENTTTTDYFQLIYECIETHKTFLNFVDFKTHSQVEPDIDLALLQAVLICKKNK